MPAVTSGKILVTGANSFVGTWAIKALLDKGFSVRGVVRSPSKGKHLTDNLFKSYGSKFELAIVEDITKEGAFDEVAKGVDGVQHVASPSDFRVDDPSPDAMIKPAIDGTMSILKTAFKEGSTIRRVVFVGSCASVLEISAEPRTFSEENWNNKAVEEVKTQGKDAMVVSKYCASKTLAERAAWEFYNARKATSTCDIVFINPPYVVGPILSEVTTPETMNESMREWYNYVVLGKQAMYDGSSYIDIRDFAEMLEQALEKPAAGGERIIASTGPFLWQIWLEHANAITPTPTLATGIPKPDPERRKNSQYMMMYDTKKEEKILGIKKRSMAETTKDIILDFSKRGW